MHLIDAAPEEIAPEPTFNAEADTRFLLFTRSNPTVGQRITWTAASVSASNFNSAHPTRVLIHGFNSGASNSVVTASTAAYLQRGNFNVIAYDKIESQLNLAFVHEPFPQMRLERGRVDHQLCDCQKSRATSL
jgi:hypothetical protein